MMKEAYAAGEGAESSQAGRCGSGFRGHYGPPLPVKLAILGVAFLIARPLGFIVLAVMFKALRRHGMMGDWGAFKWGPGAGWRRHRSNSAMDEKRRATLEALAEEEKAFADFEQRERDAREREIFEKFVAERNTPKSGA